MKDGPIIANIAALIGDPARANMLTALMDGRALTVTELAQTANVTIQTASGHLTKLDNAKLIVREKQGRHCYFRLSDTDVAQLLEALMGLAQRTGAVRVRTGPLDNALRTARICYDHLAGERGVDLLDRLVSRGMVGTTPDLFITEKGSTFFREFGIDMAALRKARRPICRSCLDWSERRYHLGGGLGAALLASMIERKWIYRDSGRTLQFTKAGLRDFAARF